MIKLLARKTVKEFLVQCTNVKCLLIEVIEIDNKGNAVDLPGKLIQHGSRIYCDCGSHKPVNVFKF